MNDETTSRLEQALKSVKTDSQAKDFATNHSVGFKYFFEYINAYIADRQIVVSEMIARSGVSTNYIYNILNGVTKNPGRDKIIAICIAAGMNLDEVNRGLKISGHNHLYPKNERDVYIAACINRGEQNITNINIELERLGIDPIQA